VTLRVITASWLLPVSRPPIRDGAVAVRDGLIEWVGQRGDAPPGRLEALGTGVLMPGLINAHCHLELSHLRPVAKGGEDFVPWVERVVRDRAQASLDTVRDAIAAAINWLEQETATVGIGDISNTLETVGGLGSSQLRAVVFHEVLGWDPAQAQLILDSADARERELGGGGKVDIRLAAHAPHSVSPALFAKMRERGAPAAVHLAESPAEREFLGSGLGEWPAFLRARGLGHVPFAPPGVSSVEYLERLDVLRSGLLAAHAVHVSAKDAGTLARRGVAVVHCPRSNRNLRVGVAPVSTLRAEGVRVCLGTDSLASGEDLDVGREMAEASRQFPDIPAREILRMGTLNGAEALGFTTLGALEPGRQAAMAFAAANDVPTDPEAFVVSGQSKLRRVS
jgi:cytosine/adenosine deaminase-related metal-dependent hydrolase